MIKKYTIALLMILGMSILISQTTPKPKEKENTYIFNEGQVIMLYNSLALTKQILPTSQAPAIQVTQLTQSFDSIQKIITAQYQNFHPDTTKVKK